MTIMNSNPLLKLNLPTTDAEMRSTYLSGKKAILKNLPTPTVKCISNHSYATIRSCINDYLIAGKLPPKIMLSLTRIATYIKLKNQRWLFRLQITLEFVQKHMMKIT